MAKLDFKPVVYEELPADKRPSLLQALVPIVGLIVFLGVGAVYLGLDPQLPLVWSLALTGIVARYWLGISWEKLYNGIIDSISVGMQAVLILFVIYMLISTLTAAGTIPALIYYGLNILSPQIFLPVTALISTLVAFTIGSSWTTAGTLGVAFMGIGAGLGIPAPMTAGAVLSGAYTGDKISPLSDTTNLAAAVTNTDLLVHTRTMRVGTGIALGLSLVGYSYLGLQFSGAIPVDQLQTIQTAISHTYSLNPVVFLPLIVMFGLAFYGFPALPSLLAGFFVSSGVMYLAQGSSFTHVWKVAQNGATPHTGAKIVNNLLATSGLIGSAWTITIVVAALSLGGLLERSGVLATVAHHLQQAINGKRSLTIGTGIAALGMNALTAEQYMSIVIPGLTLRGTYEEYELESRNLSRAIEAAGTTTSALIPWNAGAVYMAGVLGVPTLTMTNHGLAGYAPYYFLGILSPLVLFAMGLTGWRITHKPGTEASSKGSAGTVDD